MSTHGRSGIGRWLLGSVAEKIIQHSRAPVLLIRAH
jgi:nucleotide-binding universal stress UspA family protein